MSLCVEGNAQVVEDEADVALERAYGRADAVFAVGLDDAAGQRSAQGRHFKAGDESTAEPPISHAGATHATAFD
jgi:hypothetical protein